MKKRNWTIVLTCLCLLSYGLNSMLVTTVSAQQFSGWKLHDITRSLPPLVNPAVPGTQKQAGTAPSDAVVLFDGKDLSMWRSPDGTPARWKVENGYVEVVKGTGGIRTYQNFGDCQLHVEWAAPQKVEGKGQGRGNSGILLMGRYEIQVLDSYDNFTYPDGQASAVYSQYPPLVNACLPPGQWQAYDMVFHRPRFDNEGNVEKPATVTVLHNGVLVHDHVSLEGEVTWIGNLEYRPHPDRLPLMLQDHGNPVRFRNIWIRDLEPPRVDAVPPPPESSVTVPSALLDSYAGIYGEQRNIVVEREGDRLLCRFFGNEKRELSARSDTIFYSKDIDIEITFQSEKGKTTGLKLRLFDSVQEAPKMD